MIFMLSVLVFVALITYTVPNDPKDRVLGFALFMGAIAMFLAVMAVVVSGVGTETVRFDDFEVLAFLNEEAVVEYDGRVASMRIEGSDETYVSRVEGPSWWLLPTDAGIETLHIGPDSLVDTPGS